VDSRQSIHTIVPHRSPPARVQHDDPGIVAVLAYNGLCTFEYGIAIELFQLARPELGVRWYTCRIVGVDGREARGSGGVSVRAEAGPAALRRARTIVVPGWRDRTEPPPEPLRRELVRAVERGARVLTICSGAFVLGHAGLLDGRRATTHWRYINELRERFPAVQVEDDVLYVEDGPLITSAGSAAGIDAGLHLIRQDFGTEVANRVARRLVMPAHREGGQAQYVETPVAPRPGRTLAPVLDWARARLDTPLSMDTLAARAAMSPRTFLRRFEATVGTSPHAWLQHERMARARALLEGGALPLAQVAEQCGYASGETFRAAFRRVVGVAPGAYRARFGRGGG
jgi:AraC family transcriptional regulator, transcriptional activator FtrA